MLDKEKVEHIISKLTDLQNLIDNHLYPYYSKEALTKELAEIEDLKLSLQKAYDNNNEA